jgi:hypothetical protein
MGELSFIATLVRMPISLANPIIQANPIYTVANLVRAADPAHLTRCLSPEHLFSPPILKIPDSIGT